MDGFEIGTRLKQLIIASDRWSYRTLGLASGDDTGSYIQSLCNGRILSPGVVKIKEICEAGGFDLAFVLGLTREESVHEKSA